MENVLYFNAYFEVHGANVYIFLAFADLVTLMLAGGTEAENAKEELKEKMSAIKTIANDYKKSSEKK